MLVLRADGGGRQEKASSWKARSACLVQDKGSRDRGIERLDGRPHRDRHVFVRGVEEIRVQAVTLSADEQREGPCQIGVEERPAAAG